MRVRVCICWKTKQLTFDRQRAKKTQLRRACAVFVYLYCVWWWCAHMRHREEEKREWHWRALKNCWRQKWMVANKTCTQWIQENSGMGKHTRAHIVYIHNINEISIFFGVHLNIITYACIQIWIFETIHSSNAHRLCGCVVWASECGRIRQGDGVADASPNANERNNILKMDWLRMKANTKYKQKNVRQKTKGRRERDKIKTRRTTTITTTISTISTGSKYNNIENYFRKKNINLVVAFSSTSLFVLLFIFTVAYV